MRRLSSSKALSDHFRQLAIGHLKQLTPKIRHTYSNCHHKVARFSTRTLSKNIFPSLFSNLQSRALVNLLNYQQSLIKLQFIQMEF